MNSLIKLIPAAFLVFAVFQLSIIPSFQWDDSQNTILADRQASFQEALSTFEKADLPYTIGEEASIPKDKAIKVNFLYSEYGDALKLPVEVSAQDTEKHFVGALLAERHKFRLVTYYTISGENTNYNLVTLNNEGQWIDSQHIAQTNKRNAIVDKDLNITTYEYKDNRGELHNKATFTVTKNGKIEKVEEGVIQTSSIISMR